jgi:hypothetical protein
LLKPGTIRPVIPEKTNGFAFQAMIWLYVVICKYQGGIMLILRAIWVIAILSFLYVMPFKAHAEIIFDARVNNNDVKLLL